MTCLACPVSTALIPGGNLLDAERTSHQSREEIQNHPVGVQHYSRPPEWLHVPLSNTVGTAEAEFWNDSILLSTEIVPIIFINPQNSEKADGRIWTVGPFCPSSNMHRKSDYSGEPPYDRDTLETGHWAAGWRGGGIVGLTSQDHRIVLWEILHGWISLTGQWLPVKVVYWTFRRISRKGFPSRLCQGWAIFLSQWLFSNPKRVKLFIFLKAILKIHEPKYAGVWALFW